MAPRHQPAHIAIIMDGNGRWAAARGLPRLLGHRAGAEAVSRVVEAAREMGLQALTLYAFSWENWDRPREEIDDLMRLLDEFVRREAPRLHAHRIRLRTMGRLDALPASALTNLRRVIEETAGHAGMTLTLALSYGGRQEIVDAARRLAAQAARGTLAPEAIDEARFAAALYCPDLPDPDLIIRTSGEQRLSNFLLWQSSYAEFYVTPTLWPDFGKAELAEAVAEYERRERRFGKTAAAA
jgi:undecaprenyl diphosphate synthase